MTYFYRITPHWLSMLIFFCWVAGQSAQAQSDSLLQHKIWVKLNSPLPSDLHSQSNLETGKTSFDQLSQGCGVVRIQRVFAPTQKFEKAHRQYGLDLWYEVQFVDTLTTAVHELASLFCKNQWVTTAEAIPVRTRFYSTKASDELDNIGWNDPRYKEQWHYNNTGQSDGTPGADIHLSSAWPINNGDSSVIVAIIDGGIDVKHEDLKGAMWVNQGEQQGTPLVDDDGNGYVDDIYGYGFGDKRSEIHSDRHGTHVAGTIGAINNNKVGVSGVAGGDGKHPGVRLMSCAVFGVYGQGGFPEAFVYAADNGAVIAQNSWGGGGKSQILEDAIRYFTERAGYDNTDEKFEQRIQTGPMAGGLVVFAAGNNSSDRKKIAYPASLESVLTVAALDHKDIKSGFSNYGDWVDIAAPGSEILSTLPGNSYGYLSGTSMACPHVSGVAALAVSRFKRTGFTSEHLRRMLLAGVDNIDAVNPSLEGQLGSGRVNAYRVLSSDTKLPPAAVADLAQTEVTFHSALFTLTATGADGALGSAAQYDLRFSTKPINKDNFAEAQQAFVSRLPLPSGSSDTLEVTGLQANTTYYFALKVIDLLNYSSALSNVVTVKTLEPPYIQVQPKVLAATVEARTSIVDTLVIDNSRGKSPLTFNIAMDSADASLEWFHWSLDSGVVAAGKSLIVRVVWDTRRLYAGDYEATLVVTSNDPENPTVEVPLRLTVTGTPALSVSASTLNYGNVYLTFSHKRLLEIRNVGTDTLNIESIEANTRVFQSDTSVFNIPPGEQRTVTITFTPETEGEYSNALTIHSNDPQNDSYIVGLKAQALVPPPLLTTPEKIQQEIEQGKSYQRNIRLQNTSFTDTLFWNVEEDTPGWLSLSGYSGMLEPRAKSQLMLTLSAENVEIGSYSTEISFQVSDDDVEALPVFLDVVPLNLPPIWTDSLLDFSVRIEEAEVEINLANYISDPEQDILRFNFQLKEPGKAIVRTENGSLIIQPQALGSFQGSLTATDEKGNQATVSVSIEVLPTNRTPQPVSEIIAMTMRLSDQPFTIDLDSLFLDLDGDFLLYSFARPFSSPDDLVALQDSVVNLHIENQMLIGQTRALGQGKVLIYAYDPSGEYATTRLDFSVLPPNHAPLVQQTIDSQQLIEQEQFTLNLSALFRDPDEDTLIYQVAVDDTTVAQAAVKSGMLSITALAIGETMVTVTAWDEAGERVSHSFNIIVARVTAVVPSQEEALQLYPNPASEWVNIIYPNVQKVQVYDTQGTMLYEARATMTGSIHFSVASLPRGVYQVVVFTQHGPVHRTSMIRE